MLVDDGCDDDNDGYCDVEMTLVPGALPSTCPLGGGDCYDYSNQVHPGATEIDGDGIDNDCDGTSLGDAIAGGVIEPQCTGPCTGNTIGAAMCAMEICYPGYVQNPSVYSPTGADVSGAWSAISHYGSANNDLAPFAGNSYLVMGSGFEPSTSHQDYLPGNFGGSDPYANDGFTINDAVEMKVTLTAPPGVTGFSIDYIFMSAEYEEWIGSDFNDRFYIILTAPQTTNGQDKVINFTQCSNPSSYWDFQDANGKWCYIAINTAFSEKCPNAPTNISGTGHECSSDGSSTGWLTTKASVNEGETFTLRFHIHDTSDSAYDSTVLIDNFLWEGGEFTEGTVTHK